MYAMLPIPWSSNTKENVYIKPIHTYFHNRFQGYLCTQSRNFSLSKPNLYTQRNLSALEHLSLLDKRVCDREHQFDLIVIINESLKTLKSDCHVVF